MAGLSNEEMDLIGRLKIGMRRKRGTEKSYFQGPDNPNKE
jgi:hypothetical protein